MSCASKADRRGFTLVEVMIVTAIVLIFTGGAAAIFIQLIQTSDAIDARIDAVKNGRFFLDTLSDDLAQASINPAIPRAEMFVGVNTPLPFGDLADNDHDGVVDEEAPDGVDNDGDWMLARDDHDFQTIFAGGGPISVAERGWHEPDLGDGHVDEDVVFNSDELSFWIRGPLTGNVLRQQVTYRVEPFEGEENVAVRHVHTLHSDGTPPTDEVGPLAFKVVSLNFLYWDHRQSPQRWVESWDSGAIAPAELGAPVSVYAEITVHSDSTALSLPPTRPLSVMRMGTAADIESVLRSPLFPRGAGRPEGVPRALGVAQATTGQATGSR
jgi:prepilin-type N-terminal cleavage/methylation domain-containing protein